MSSARRFASLVTCCALVACTGLAACAPKRQDARTGMENALSQEEKDVDSALVLDRELYLASTSPGTLVESDSLSVSELAEHRAPYGDALELTSDPSSWQLPSGLLQMEAGPSSDEERQWNVPRPGSSEARKLAELNTKAALCSTGETVCITSPYGVRRSSRRSHKGIDIRAPLGSPIMAFRGGTVVCAEYHSSYGYMVEIQQDDGIVSRYAHMSQILVRKGERVTPGLMIGRVGSTGRSTGPHLHFELLIDNRQTNPMTYLPTPKQVVTKGTEADAAAARKALSKSKRSSSRSKVAKTSSKTKKTASVRKSSSSKKSSVSSSKKTSSRKTVAKKTSSSKKTSVRKTSSKKTVAAKTKQSATKK